MRVLTHDTSLFLLHARQALPAYRRRTPRTRSVLSLSYMIRAESDHHWFGKDVTRPRLLLLLLLVFFFFFTVPTPTPTFPLGGSVLR